jgi:hypothetical protein
MRLRTDAFAHASSPPAPALTLESINAAAPQGTSSERALILKNTWNALLSDNTDPPLASYTILQSDVAGPFEQTHT